MFDYAKSIWQWCLLLRAVQDETWPLSPASRAASPASSSYFLISRWFISTFYIRTNVCLSHTVSLLNLGEFLFPSPPLGLNLVPEEERRREIWPRAGTQFPVRQVHNTGCSFTEGTLLTGSLNISTVGTCFTFLCLSVPPVNESISSLLCLKCAGVKYKEQLLNSKRQIKETFSKSCHGQHNIFYTLSKKGFKLRYTTMDVGNIFKSLFRIYKTTKLLMQHHNSLHTHTQEQKKKSQKQHFTLTISASKST